MQCVGMHTHLALIICPLVVGSGHQPQRRTRARAVRRAPLGFRTERIGRLQALSGRGSVLQFSGAPQRVHAPVPQCSARGGAVVTALCMAVTHSACPQATIADWQQPKHGATCEMLSARWSYTYTTTPQILDGVARPTSGVQRSGRTLYSSSTMLSARWSYTCRHMQVLASAPEPHDRWAHAGAGRCLRQQPAARQSDR